MNAANLQRLQALAAMGDTEAQARLDRHAQRANEKPMVDISLQFNRLSHANPTHRRPNKRTGRTACYGLKSEVYFEVDVPEGLEHYKLNCDADYKALEGRFNHIATQIKVSGFPHNWNNRPQIRVTLTYFVQVDRPKHIPTEAANTQIWEDIKDEFEAALTDTFVKACLNQSDKAWQEQVCRQANGLANRATDHVMTKAKEAINFDARLAEFLSGLRAELKAEAASQLAAAITEYDAELRRNHLAKAVDLGFQEAEKRINSEVGRAGEGGFFPGFNTHKQLTPEEVFNK